MQLQYRQTFMHIVHNMRHMVGCKGPEKFWKSSRNYPWEVKLELSMGS